jgi:hypothetical protein
MKTSANLNIILILSSVFFILSCNNSSKKNMTFITERIQYDVPIKSPDPDYDWWVQNIEGPKREAFVRMIIESAYSGKYRVYDYFNNPLTAEQVKNIGYRRDTLTFQRTNPPYALYDTIVEKKLELRDITRIRFLEEWYMDENHLIMQKKVVGIAPITAVYSDSGELRGYMPLFWIYMDEKYPVK